MKIIVLGKNGMLGRYVYTYLSNYFDTIGTTRQTLDTHDDSLYNLDIKEFLK
jgi:dTDP-4-dehydrorhamnose reductase